MNRFICPTCGAAVCTAHRFEDDHDCKQRQKDKAEQLRSARVGFFKKHAGAGSGRRARASSDGGGPTASASTSRPPPSVPIQQATTGSSLFSSGAGSYTSFDNFAPPQRTAASGSTGNSTTTAGASQFDAVGGRMVFENTTTVPNQQQSQNISAGAQGLPSAQEMITTKERSYRANGNPLSSVMRRNKSKEKHVPSNEPINCPQCTLTNPAGTAICISTEKNPCTSSFCMTNT